MGYGDKEQSTWLDRQPSRGVQIFLSVLVIAATIVAVVVACCCCWRECHRWWTAANQQQRVRPVDAHNYDTAVVVPPA